MGSLRVVAEDVRRSVRQRLLFANVAGGIAVITFVLLASGERLAPDVPLALTLGADAQTVLRVVDGTLIGGVTTCAIGYLMIERSFRPLFAHVLGCGPRACCRSAWWSWPSDTRGSRPASVSPPGGSWPATWAPRPAMSTRSSGRP